MTTQELAATLNGREYTKEISDFEEEHAKQNRLLVVFGGSDDLMEFRGVLCDEAGAPGEVLISRYGKLLPCPDEDEEEVIRKFGLMDALTAQAAGAISITAVWGDGSGPSWTYKTEEPHSTFEIMDDGTVYCRGMVIQL